MLIVLFLVSHFNFLFVPCGGLSWLPVSFLLHVKYTLSYRIVSAHSLVADAVMWFALVEDITFDHAPSPQHPAIYTDCLVECIVSGQPVPVVSWRYRGRKVFSRKCLHPFVAIDGYPIFNGWMDI